MTPTDTPAAVLFADVADSSRLYRELGDRAASRLVTALLDALEDEVGAEAGRVIDRIGDELMCLFPGPAAAVRAARSLQLRCREFATEHPDAPPLHLRVGLQAGDVLERDGRLFGDCVYVAKRLTDASKAGQVLLSEEILGRLGDVGESFRFVDKTTLKGQSRPTRMHELLWDALDTTKPTDRGSVIRVAAHVLVLEGLGREHRLTEGSSLTIGRSQPSELRLPASEVSRLHARIECVRGRFSLHDVSTNGTYVRVGDETEHRYVRRDQIFLEGDGLLGLGAPPASDSVHTLRYRMTDAPESP